MSHKVEDLSPIAKSTNYAETVSGQILAQQAMDISRSESVDGSNKPFTFNEEKSIFNKGTREFPNLKAASGMTLDLFGFRHWQFGGVFQDSEIFEGFVPNIVLDQIARANPNDTSFVTTKFIAAELAIRCQEAQEIARLKGYSEGAVYLDRASGDLKVDLSRGNGERKIYSAQNGRSLPGKLVREATGVTADEISNHAFDETGLARDFIKSFGRNGWDGKGGTFITTTHYGERYHNAQFNGQQTIFGDGDKKGPDDKDYIFESFVEPTVTVHEWFHGVVDRTCSLEYRKQSGALNESIVDCFALAKWQKDRGLPATADREIWYQGRVFNKSLDGNGGDAKALRNLLYPGTAYNHPKIGHDRQVADMDHYKDISEDNGGVHIYSGIPNRAFALACVEIGGMAADKPAAVLWDAMIHAKSNCNFKQFAELTLDASKRLYANEPRIETAFRHAWETVKVIRTADSTS